VKQSPRQAISTATVTLLDEIGVAQGHQSWIRSVCFSPDGSLMASASNDHSVRLWDVRGGTPVPMSVLEGHHASVWGLAFSPDSLMLASTGNNRAVHLWDLQTAPHELLKLTDHNEAVYSAAFSADGHLLASGSYDNTVRVRDVSRVRRAGQVHSSAMLNHISHVYAVAFSPAGLLATASRDSLIRLWEIPTGDLRPMSSARPHGMTGHRSWVNTLAFSNDGRLLASGGNERWIIVWDMSNGLPVMTLEGHSDAVTSVAFSPDSRLLVSASKDKTARIWDITSGSHLATITDGEHWLYSAAFSPDGRLLALAGGGLDVRLYGIRPVPAANGW
jgi:WD40 repeat protein